MQASTKKYLYIISSLAAAIIVSSLGLLVGFRIVYPNKYSDTIHTYTQQYQVDKQLIQAIIWVESKYDPKAKSNSGALGLMQIMPDTAQWLNSTLEQQSQDLFEPSYNIHLGVYYIKLLLERFGDISLTLAAYNAGPTNVSRWLTNPNYALNGRLVNIPFKETKNYIARVIKVTKIYSRLY
ncbi:MAG: lytic transglycosylase domain-containing protein [Clostridiales bacterium]|jgi:soluble lytic murein transglycosylase|nr:lytic transglycosylase domain-containing protein [Clostridiales bacterium]